MPEYFFTTIITIAATSKKINGENEKQVKLSVVKQVLKDCLKLEIYFTP